MKIHGWLSEQRLEHKHMQKHWLLVKASGRKAENYLIYHFRYLFTGKTNCENLYVDSACDEETLCNSDVQS